MNTDLTPDDTATDGSLTPMYGGFHVKDTADGHSCIDVLRMMYNWRIVIGPKDPGPHVLIDRGWCYFGHGVDANGEERTMMTSYLKAVAAALAWDGTGEPHGYDKIAGA